MYTANDLAGFDMVFAVTQEAINDQLQLLSALSLIPDTWQMVNPVNASLPPKIDANLDSPNVSLTVGDASSREVKVNFPITSGTFTYYVIDYTQMDPNTGQPKLVTKEAKMDGWTVTFIVNMSLAEIAQADIQAHKAIPKEVKEQLTSFDPNDIDIQHLFLNFEDANLIENYELDSGGHPDMNAPEVIGQFKNVLKGLLGRLQGSDNPFILGYVADQKTDTTTTVSTFTPTGTTFSVFPDAVAVPRSALNYLLITDGKDVPGSGYGLFTRNWVTADDVQGDFVISEALMMGQFLSQLASTLGTDASSFSSTNGNASFTLTKGNDQGGQTTCTVTPQVNSGNILLDFLFTFKKDMHDSSAFHSYIGYVDGTVHWTSTISYYFDADDNLLINTTTSDQVVTHQNHPNALGEFESFLAAVADFLTSVVTFGQVNDLYTNMIEADWTVSVKADLATAVNGITEKIIMPAGNKLFFKNPRFTTGGHLELDTTFKN